MPTDLRELVEGLHETVCKLRYHGYGCPLDGELAEGDCIDCNEAGVNDHSVCKCEPELQQARAALLDLLKEADIKDEFNDVPFRHIETERVREIIEKHLTGGGDGD